MCLSRSKRCARSKRRKALVLSDAVFNQKNASSLLVMITSQRRPQCLASRCVPRAVEPSQLAQSLSRPELFTLDNRLILGTVWDA